MAKATSLGDEALRLVGYVETDWCREPWSEGCYDASMGPGTMMKFGPALRVAKAGTTGWKPRLRRCGQDYIEGAVRSANARVLSADR